MEGDYDNVASDNIHCSEFMNSTNCVCCIAAGSVMSGFWNSTNYELYSSKQCEEWLLEQHKL